MNVLGLDLGGTKLASALFNEQGTILYRDLSYLENKKGAEVGLLINRHINQQIKKAYQLKLKISAIGISVPGIYLKCHLISGGPLLLMFHMANQKCHA